MDILSNINVIFYLVAYLVGGIPFGLLLAKKFAGVDIKNSGSMSIGATNVLRVVKEKSPVLAKKLGIATLLLDALKGMVVLFVAYLLGVNESTLWSIAVLSVIGHCYSPYLGFEGGKGVATGLGVMLFLLPVETIIAIFVWAVSVKIIKISSISSLIALVVLLVSSFIIHPNLAHAPIVLIAFILSYKHIPNIVRLIKREEERVV